MTSNLAHQSSNFHNLNHVEFQNFSIHKIDMFVFCYILRLLYTESGKNDWNFCTTIFCSEVMSQSSAALQLRYLQVSKDMKCCPSILPLRNQYSQSPSPYQSLETFCIVNFPIAVTCTQIFQTLNSISAEKNSTIIFPLPIDLVRSVVEWYWIFE